MTIETKTSVLNIHDSENFKSYYNFELSRSNSERDFANQQNWNENFVNIKDVFKPYMKIGLKIKSTDLLHFKDTNSDVMFYQHTNRVDVYKFDRSFFNLLRRQLIRYNKRVVHLST